MMQANAPAVERHCPRNCEQNDVAANQGSDTDIQLRLKFLHIAASCPAERREHDDRGIRKRAQRRQQQAAHEAR